MKNLILFLFIITVFVLSSCTSTSGGESSSSKPPLEPTIEGVLVVNYFENKSPGDAEEKEPEWISRSVTDFLISEISGLDFLKVVSRDSLSDVMEEQNLSLSGITEESMEIGRILKADYILSGDYYEHEGRLTLNARLLDAETAETIRAFQVSDIAGSIYTMQERLLYQFLNFNNITLQPDQLAARDYETDQESIQSYYKAEELIQENRKKEARRVLEELLEKNRLYTPAQESLARLKSQGSGTSVDGQAILKDLDEELRQEIRYRNLTESFIAYSEVNAYQAIAGEPQIDTTDGELYSLIVDGIVVVRNEYLDFLSDFVEAHAYIPDHEKTKIVNQIKEIRKRRKENEWFFQNIKVPFTEDMFGPENAYGFLKLSLVDSSGKAFWEFYTSSYKVPWNENVGEIKLSQDTMGFEFNAGGIKSFNWYAFFGKRNNWATISNSFYLSQGSFSLRINRFHAASMSPDHADRVFHLKREDIGRLAEIEVEPWFYRTKSWVAY